MHVAMKVKFALEQPSDTGVGHELSKGCAFMHVLQSQRARFMSMTTH